MSKYEIENVKLTAPKLDRNDMHVKSLIVRRRFLKKIGMLF